MFSTFRDQLLYGLCTMSLSRSLRAVTWTFFILPVPSVTISLNLFEVSRRRTCLFFCSVPQTNSTVCHASMNRARHYTPKMPSRRISPIYRSARGKIRPIDACRSSCFRGRSFGPRKRQNTENPAADLQKHEESWRVANVVSRRKSRYLYPHRANTVALRTQGFTKGHIMYKLLFSEITCPFWFWGGSRRHTHY